MSECMKGTRIDFRAVRSAIIAVLQSHPTTAWCLPDDDIDSITAEVIGLLIEFFVGTHERRDP